jgi:hypothetical protein
MHKKPNINLVTAPHPVPFIQDQIDFFKLALDQDGLSYQISKALSPDMFNIVIEGFNKVYAQHINSFCQKYNQPIALILTEHLKLTSTGTLKINEVSAHKNNEYMPNAVDRLEALCSILPHVRFFLTLGHLPFNTNISDIFKTIPVIQVPYPKIAAPDTLGSQHKEHDFLFQGNLTRYRTKIIKKIRKLSDKCSVQFNADPETRAAELRKARYYLQVPQYKKWPYLSPMRCLFALRNGVSMLNVSDHRLHPFDDIFPRINPENLTQELNNFLLSPHNDCFQGILSSYNAYTESQPASKLPYMLNLYK